MKNLITICLIFLGSLILAQPAAHVKDPKRSFGNVKRGTQVKFEYEITNTGNQPLMVNSHQVVCSCTTVEYSQEPVLPGKTMTVKVNFNTNSVYGRQDREVLLFSNASDKPLKIRFRGTVTKDQ